MLSRAKDLAKLVLIVFLIQPPPANAQTVNNNPLLLVYLALRVTIWGVLKVMQPDLYYWVVAVAVALFVKGVVELMLVLRSKEQL